MPWKSVDFCSQMRYWQDHLAPAKTLPCDEVSNTTAHTLETIQDKSTAEKERDYADRQPAQAKAPTQGLGVLNIKKRAIALFTSKSLLFPALPPLSRGWGIL